MNTLRIKMLLKQLLMLVIVKKQQGLLVKELFTNDDNRLSTTNTIQMMSAITLCVGFVISLFLDRSVTAELGFITAGMATLTATSKGFVGMRK